MPAPVVPTLRNAVGGAARAAGEISCVPRHERKVNIQLPTRAGRVPRGQVQRQTVADHLIQVDIAKENGVQRQKAIEHELARIVMGVGEAGLDGELARGKTAGFLIDVFHALGNFAHHRQGRAIAAGHGSVIGRGVSANALVADVGVTANGGCRALAVMAGQSGQLLLQLAYALFLLPVGLRQITDLLLQAFEAYIGPGL